MITKDTLQEEAKKRYSDFKTILDVFTEGGEYVLSRLSEPSDHEQYGLRATVNKIKALYHAGSTITDAKKDEILISIIAHCMHNNTKEYIEENKLK